MSGHEHTKHVLLVEDDPATRHAVADFFAIHGVQTTAAASRTELQHYLAIGEPALIILGQRVGMDNGLDLLRSIRASSDVPVIIADRERPEEIDRVLGLELGADDYIAKPFQLRELVARVRAVLRRCEGAKNARAPEATPSGYAFDGWRLDLATRRLTNPEGLPVSLTKSEFALLVAFLSAPQRVLGREQLLRSTRVHEDIFDRSVDVQVLRLRRRLHDDVVASRLILTQRGVGYSFGVPVRAL